MSSSFLGVLILLTLSALVSGDSSESETSSEKTAVQGSNESNHDSGESSTNTTHKKVKLRGRQKSFIRNPNYFSANEYFKKIFKNAHIRKRYMEHVLPHPGF